MEDTKGICLGLYHILGGNGQFLTFRFRCFMIPTFVVKKQAFTFDFAIPTFFTNRVNQCL